jgi:hypothetical protein
MLEVAAAAERVICLRMRFAVRLSAWQVRLRDHRPPERE